MSIYTSSGGKKLIHSQRDRVQLLDGEQFIIVDRPAPYVSRITLNRPEKRNCMNHELRGQLFNQLQINDQDPDIRVTILRGAGNSFCAGYDIDMKKGVPLPLFEADGEGRFMRHVLAGWFMMMDMAKPIIAQVHGYCLAGGSELASACDLVFVADNAKIGYPPVRTMGLPDSQIFPWLMGMRKAMEIMLTGDTISGVEAAQYGWATRSFPEDQLEAKTLELAQRVAKIPSDLLALNKRSVHRAMEMKGMRAHLRSGTDLAALSTYTPTSRAFMKQFTGTGHTAKKAFSKRDSKFGDNRVAKQQKSAPPAKL